MVGQLVWAHMDCKKCYGTHYEEGDELNTVDFGDAGAITLCDHCAPRAYNYLLDFF